MTLPDAIPRWHRLLSLAMHSAISALFTIILLSPRDLNEAVPAMMLILLIIIPPIITFILYLIIDGLHFASGWRLH